MRIPTVLLLAATLLFFGCTGVPEEAEDSKRWTAALVEKIQSLPHVDRLQDVQYSLQGAFNHNQAWISGTVHSDSNDDTTNLKLIDEVGRGVATALADNPIEDSWVKIEVVGSQGRGYGLDDVGLPTAPTLDDLAKRYNIVRK